jgi:dTDP-4-dehydrorhamnose reductase
MPDKTRVLVTGGKGMLGSAFEQQAKHFQQFEVRALGRDELDVCDNDAVMACADWVQNGWIIHCAAKVDVDGCANDPEAARAIIVEGTRNVARLAAHSSARMLYPQSFLIYDGRENPIAEDETPRPL